MSAFAVLFAFVLAPTAYAAARQLAQQPPAAEDTWSLAWRSALAFTLAFNVMFFVQEISLVLPKALTPGLTPTLFHNNHAWLGTHPDVDLLQGTGAAGTLLAGVLAVYWLVRHTPRTLELRLFVFWLAILGFLTPLPQFVIGAAIHQNDVGRALTWLGLTPAARWTVAALSMLAMAALCWRLAAYLLPVSLAESPPSVRARATAWLAVIPSLAAIVLIAPFRVLNHPIEVWLPPVMDAWIAGAWLWAASWHVAPANRPEPRPGAAMWLPLAVIALLAFFHLVLAPGVTL